MLVFRAGRRHFAIVLEVQLGNNAEKRRKKRRAWPRYLASLWSDRGCPIYLVVVTPSVAIERWARKPIRIGHPGFILTPIVIGPSNVPREIARERAMQCPELAVLAAVVHGRHQGAAEIGKLAVEAALASDEDQSRIYVDLVLDALGTQARREVELMMTEHYEYRSEFFRKLVAEGQEKGREEAMTQNVLDVLEARGFKVSKRARARIERCGDVEMLRIWLRRAATLSRVQELFE